MDIFDAMRTQRSVRDFADREVSDEDIDRILEAASWAPNAGNRQLWEFIVVRDAATKQTLAEIYRESFDVLGKLISPDPPLPDGRTHPKTAMKWSRTLADTLETVPVLIVIGYDRSQSPFTAEGSIKAFADETVYTGVMPAVQNLMLAARALGLGTCLTTAANVLEGKTKQALGVPQHIQLVALLPLGYPAGEFKEVSRIPVSEKVHYDAWSLKRVFSEAP
jgi:nitroreductase